MKKLVILFLVLVCGGVHSSWATSSNPSYLMNGSGGSQSGGSSVEADLFSGAATYSLPITLPPSKLGVLPQLNLNYSSQRKNPNSWVGYGWDLDAGRIERLGDDLGVPDMIEGTNFQIRFAGQTEKLVLVDQNVNPNDYGLSVSSTTRVELYKTLVESGFEHYLHLIETAPTDDNHSLYEDLGWVVVDRKGYQYTFGDDTDARIEKRQDTRSFSIASALYGSPEYQMVTSVWMLTAIQDPYANQVILNYEASSKKLSAIYYDDIGIYFRKTSAIHHDYNVFPIHKQYYLTSINELASQLDGIVIRSNGTQLQAYDFIYDDEITPNRFRYLTQIKRYGRSSSEALPDIEFDYYDFDSNQVSWAHTPLRFQASRQLSSGEYNDGYLDDYTKIVDMNGDGLPDQVVSYPGHSNIYVYFNDGNGFQDWGTASQWSTPTGFDICADDWACGRLTGSQDGFQKVFFQDFNGDLLPDWGYLRLSSTGSTTEWYFHIALNDGKGFNHYTYWRDPYQDNHDSNAGQRVGLMDLNGDSLVDRIVGSEDGFFQLYYNYGSGFRSSGDYWSDPVGAWEGDNPGQGQLTFQYEGNVWHTFKDFNNDGLIDRMIKNNCHEGDTLVGACNGIALNKMGTEFFDSYISDGQWIINGFTNMGIIDPISDETHHGNVNEQAAWMDFNNDGYVDRVLGGTENGYFEVHFYEGDIAYGGYTYMTQNMSLRDRVTNIDGEHQAKGYVLKGVDADDGANVHTWMQDINGDGYPDRVTLSPRDDSTGNREYLVYFMRVNAVEFSDAFASNWDDEFVSQPAGHLKSINNGQGLINRIEYLPTTRNLRSNLRQMPHRFLPMSFYTVHKIYEKDYTVPNIGSIPEEARHTGMRMKTYNFWGGHYYVRWSFPLRSDENNLTQTRETRFNGFQQVDVISSPHWGESWQEIEDSTFFHQMVGSVSTVRPGYAHLFDSVGFEHSSLSGKIYKKQKYIASQLVAESVWDWEYDILDATLGIAWPYLHQTDRWFKELSVANRRGEVVQFDYDSWGQKTKEDIFDLSMNPLMSKEWNYYDSSVFNNSFGIVNRVEYETVSDSSGLLRRTDFQYDTDALLTQKDRWVDSSGSKKVTEYFTYYSDGRIRTKTDEHGRLVTYDYDANEVFPIKETHTLNSSGNQVEFVRSFHRMTGQKSLEVNDSGVGVYTSYDGFGRKSRVQKRDSSGNYEVIESYNYEYFTSDFISALDHVFLMTEIYKPKPGYSDTDIGNNPQAIVYNDYKGRQVQTCTYSERGDYRLSQGYPTSVHETIQYDPIFDSSCEFKENPIFGQSTTKVVDVFGRSIEFDQPDGDTESPFVDQFISYRIDANGQFIKTRYESGWDQYQRETIDALGRVVKKEDAQGEVLTYDYNADNTLNEVSHNGHALYRFEYDLIGNKTLSWNANTGTTTYEYNSLNQMYKQTKEKGNYFEVEYDVIGRPQLKTYYASDGSLERSYEFVYDSGISSNNVRLGELAAIHEYNSDGNLIRSTLYSYDSQYRQREKITRIEDWGTLTQTESYNHLDQLESIVFNGSESLFYDYDRTGNMIQICRVAECGLAAAESVYRIDPTDAYDVQGNLKKKVYGNGVETLYTYYHFSKRLKSFKVQKDSEIYTHREYEYDKHSNLTLLEDKLNQTQSGAFSNIQYDDVNRLIGYKEDATGTTHQFNYDVSGNMTLNTKSFGSDAYQYTSSKPNAVTQIGTRQFTYDDNGNMSTDPDRTFSYNALDQLSQVIMRNGNIMDYQYDYNGQRTEQKGTLSYADGSTETKYWNYFSKHFEVRDRDRIILHYYVGGDKVYSKTIGKLSGTLSPSESFFYYYHGDHLGSAHLVTEGSSSGSTHAGIHYAQGQLLQRYEYSPFGQELYVLNPGLNLDPSFTGQMFDSLTGLYYYQSRYYNPELGRFIQPDTVLPDLYNFQTYNAYSYVHNNPLRYVDPTGHNIFSDIVNAIGSVFKAIFNFFFGGGQNSIYFQSQTMPTNCFSGECGGLNQASGDDKFSFDQDYSMFNPGELEEIQNSIDSLSTDIGLDELGQQIEDWRWDPFGIEVIVFFPTAGRGRISSAGGHVAIRIDDVIHSWDNAGWNLYSEGEYMGKNTHRDAIGFSIFVTSYEKEFIKSNLHSYTRDYGLFHENCGDAIESALEDLGYDMGLNIHPVSLAESIVILHNEGEPILFDYKVYDASQPAGFFEKVDDPTPFYSDGLEGSPLW